MELTRQVLVEKELLFSKYNDPADAPDYVWESIYLKIIHKDIDYFYTYIVNKILVPILKTNEYCIQTDSTSITIKFKTDVYYMTFVFYKKHIEGFVKGFVIYPKLYDFDYLKRSICITWDARKKTFLSARHYLDNWSRTPGYDNYVIPL